MTLEEFDRDYARVVAAARKPGGLLVVDNDGNTRFRLTIPCYALPSVRR